MSDSNAGLIEKWLVVVLGLVTFTVFELSPSNELVWSNKFVANSTANKFCVAPCYVVFFFFPYFDCFAFIV